MPTKPFEPPKEVNMPKFTDDEQQIINTLRSREADRPNNFMWAYLGVGLLFAGFAAYHENTWMMLCGFALVCSCRIYEDRLQAKANPLFRSIILKYEQAIRDVGASQFSD